MFGAAVLVAVLASYHTGINDVTLLLIPAIVYPIRSIALSASLFVVEAVLVARISATGNSHQPFSLVVPFLVGMMFMLTRFEVRRAPAAALDLTLGR